MKQNQFAVTVHESIRGEPTVYTEPTGQELFADPVFLMKCNANLLEAEDLECSLVAYGGSVLSWTFADILDDVGTAEMIICLQDMMHVGAYPGSHESIGMATRNHLHILEKLALQDLVTQKVMRTKPDGFSRLRVLSMSEASRA